MDTAHYVYIFNSPQFLDGELGHNGILFEDGDGPVRLYSFHPIYNRGEPFDKGSIAHIDNPSDATSFETFEKSCLTPHPDIDHRKDNRGILLYNGTVRWVERIRRVIRMGVYQAQFDAMEAFAGKFAEHPKHFNIVTYSCQHFVNEVLSNGGIILYGEKGPLLDDFVPNDVYEHVTDETIGILSFDKIDFEGSGEWSRASGK